MYSELVFYIEACESGSMFPKLRKDQRIYAVTASNATDSSYAAYCSPNNKILGHDMGTCLGDQFSVAWMEDTEANELSIETLATQFETLKARTTKSPVQKFGQESVMNDVIGEFLGTFSERARTFYQTQVAVNTEDENNKIYSIVDSRDAKLNYLQNKVMQNDAD